MPRIRQNIVTGEWVVVSPERAHRPESFAKRLFTAKMMHIEHCAFCKNGAAWHERIESETTNILYVIPNKFPAFTKNVTLEETGHNFYQDDTSIGAHEVIVLLDPKDTLDTISAHRLYELLVTLQKRTKHYEHDANLHSFTPIYNHGIDSGASLAHPHAQFFANGLVPPRLQQEFFGAEQYHNANRTCVFCDMVDHELQEESRVIHASPGAVAFAAYAPRFPFETWILPKHHRSSFALASEHDVQAVAECMHKVFGQLAKQLNHPPYNWFIHTARSLDTNLEPAYHWHVEITPRLSTYGGYELATDMTIETVLPEVAAQFLKTR